MGLCGLLRLLRFWVKLGWGCFSSGGVIRFVLGVDTIFYVLTPFWGALVCELEKAQPMIQVGPFPFVCFRSWCVPCWSVLGRSICQLRR